MLKKYLHWILIMASASYSAACATRHISMATDIEALPDAITVPYQLSSSGRFIVDISLNEHPPQPFSIDTGATISVLYTDYIDSIGLAPSQQSVKVSGLVTIGRRPIIEDVDLNIGRQTFPLDEVVILETPNIRDEAVGLLGADILTGYTVLFNKDTLMASFVPSQNVGRNAFKGWRRIPLRNRVDDDTDARLYFAKTEVNGKNVPILIDTGSNLNFINWQLARLDADIERLIRKASKQTKLQGANGVKSQIKQTVLHDLRIGPQHWEETQVVIMGLDTLSTIAPIDEPLMIAGAGMFTPWTVAFDLGENSLYIRPNGKENVP